MDQKKLIRFLLIWIINAVLLLIFSMLFTKDVVLGNISITRSMAAIVNSLVLTGAVFLVPTLVKKLELKLANETASIAAYFIANLIVIWILKRFAGITGFGVSSILFVIIIAIVLSLDQFGVMKYSKKLLKKS